MNSLFDILTETICESNLLEAVENKHNPLENEEVEDELNHYLDDIPDEGWDYFWKSWDELSDKEFETEFGKSKEIYKQELENEVRTAKQNAVKYYKDYYSEKNPDVVEKFKKRGWHLLPGNTLEILHRKLDKISENDDTHILHYSGEKGPGVEKVSKKLSTAWGYVRRPKEEMHILLYNFTNPTIGDWQDTIYGVIVHELGHIISNILRKRLLKPYKKIKVEKIFSKKDKGKSDEYVMTDAETYSRLQNLRRHLNVTSNLTPAEFALRWLQKINDGEIEFVTMVAENTVTGKKFCTDGRAQTDENIDYTISEKPKWYRQEKAVTLEVPLDYVQVCVCERFLSTGELNNPNVAEENREKCKTKDLNFKNRTQLRAFWSDIKYNGKQDVDINSLLAKFTSNITKTKDKFYLTIDFTKIAEANEEFVQNQQPDDSETSLA